MADRILAVAHVDAIAFKHGQIAQQRLLRKARKILIEWATGLRPHHRDARPSFLVFIAVCDVFRINPRHDVHRVAFVHPMRELDDAWFLGRARHIKHPHESSLPRPKQRPDINRHRQGAIARLIRPDRKLTFIETAFGGMHIIEANGGPAGREFHE